MTWNQIEELNITFAQLEEMGVTVKEEMTL